MERRIDRRRLGQMVLASAGGAAATRVDLAFARGTTTPRGRGTVERTFNAAAGEHPENVAVGPDGALWVSLHAAGAVWRSLAGVETIFRLPLHTSTPGETRANGLVAARDGGAFVAVASGLPEMAGVWSVDTAGTWVRQASLPISAGINGMAADAAGALYVADDALGTIWRVPAGATCGEPWATWPALARRTAAGSVPYGANGIKISGGAAWVSNPSAAAIVRVPLLADGSAGEPEIVHEGPAFAAIDDFAFAAGGALYAADILANKVIRVDPNGEMQPVLGPEDGLDNPTAVAFAPGGDLLVTNAAFSGHADGPGASLVRAPLGVAGDPLPWR